MAYAYFKALQKFLPKVNFFFLYQVKVVLEPEPIGVFLTRSCVQLTDISCGVVRATLASLDCSKATE